MKIGWKNFFTKLKVKDYIISPNVFWIVGFRGNVEKEIRQKFQYHLAKDMNSINDKINLMYVDANIINSMMELYIGDYLLNNIDKNINEIDLFLIKKEIQ